MIQCEVHGRQHLVFVTTEVKKTVEEGQNMAELIKVKFLEKEIGWVWFYSGQQFKNESNQYLDQYEKTSPICQECFTHWKEVNVTVIVEMLIE